MLQTIENVNAAVNNFVWGVPAMVCIIGVGLVLSARTGFIQFRKFGYAIKNSIGRIFTKSEAKEGSITPFQAVCTALAATVGTGNIAGVAGAIAIGGAGAVFWMWVSALLGMCTKFSEVTLAVHYREKNAEGDYVGGPMYYIKNGLGKKWYWMASVYAILGSLTVLGTGNATQVNTITTSIDSALISYNVIDDAQISMVNLVIGIVIAALVAVVLLGGVKRIGTVTEKLVPFMAVFYIILAIGVVALNADKVPHVFEMIFVGAFNPSAFTGGVVGSMFMTMRRGVSRGIFSNEAGIGTGSIAHACADTDEPVKQGYNRDLYTDSTGYPLWRRRNPVRRGSRCGAYHFRIRNNIWKLGDDLYCNCNVLFRILNDSWMGTLRSKMCRVCIYNKGCETIYDRVCAGRNPWCNSGSWYHLGNCRYL